VKNETVLTYQYLFPFVLGMMTFFIFLFGWITFERMILRAAEINIISKAMQSIREYYIMKNNDIEDYLLFAKLERGPRSLASQGPLAPERNLRLGLPQAIAILNSFIAAIGSAVMVREVFGGPTGYGPLVGSLVFIIAMFIFNFHYQRRLDTLEARVADLLGKTANF
jgi:hypothetical protein